LEAAFILLEFRSPSRRIFIGSHSLPPLSGSLYRSFNLELEFKEVREAAAAEKKKLEDELAGEKRKAVEATMQLNTAATGRSNAYPF
jgi:hypothetical protein